MNRVYGEPVDVQMREDGSPAGFTWRERRYAVSSVLEYWLVNRDWWRESAPAPARPELQFWRVEAGRLPKRHVPAQGRPRAQARPDWTGVYELRLDIAAGSWTLRRIVD